MGDKLLAHADARVLDAELVAGMSRRRASLLPDPDADHATRGGVLNGVAQRSRQGVGTEFVVSISFRLSTGQKESPLIPELQFTA